MVAIKIFSIEYIADGVETDPAAAVKFYPRVDFFGMIIFNHMNTVY